MAATAPVLLAAFLLAPLPPTPPATAGVPGLVPVAAEPFPASVYSGPTLIRTEGDVADQTVRGWFSRTSSGQWQERNDSMSNAWTFHTMQQTEAEITLLDSARGVWIKLDLEARTVSYRDESGGDYIELYRITDVR